MKHWPNKMGDDLRDASNPAALRSRPEYEEHEDRYRNRVIYEHPEDPIPWPLLPPDPVGPTSDQPEQWLGVHSHDVVTGAGEYFDVDEVPCPKGRTVLLLSKTGVMVRGKWYDEGGFVAWSPCPTIPQSVKDKYNL